MYATAAAIDELNRLLIPALGSNLRSHWNQGLKHFSPVFSPKLASTHWDTLVLKIVDQGNKALLTQVIQASL